MTTPGKNKNPSPGFLWSLGIFLLKLMNGFAASVYLGWVIQLLWGWFIVTSFGLPPLTIAGVIGILIVRSALVMNTTDLKLHLYLDENTEKDSTTKWVVGWLGFWILGTAALFGGSVWHYLFFPLLGW